MCWAGFDGDEIVFASFFDSKRAARLRRDPRVTLSFQARDYDGNTLFPYLVIKGRASVTDGGAIEVMDHLAQWYIGPGADVPGPRHAVRLDLPGRDRQDLRPGPVEPPLGRDGPGEPDRLGRDRPGPADRVGITAQAALTT